MEQRFASAKNAMNRGQTTALGRKSPSNDEQIIDPELEDVFHDAHEFIQADSVVKRGTSSKTPEVLQPSASKTR